MNLTKYRKRSGYGKRVAWSRNAVAAKAKKRIERANEEPLIESECALLKVKSPPHATISIQIDDERRTFRVSRFDGKRFIALGKVQAASSIVKRLALILEAML